MSAAFSEIPQGQAVHAALCTMAVQEQTGCMFRVSHHDTVLGLVHDDLFCVRRAVQFCRGEVLSCHLVPNWGERESQQKLSVALLSTL